MDIRNWNPCAACNCRVVCLARCCYKHDDMDADCRPDKLCCPICPEQFHPQHPEGIDCNQRAGASEPKER